MGLNARKAWLDGLTEGSEVIEERGFGYKLEVLATIARVTPSQVVITTGGGERRYRRKDGLQVGGEWHQRITPADEAAKGRIRKGKNVKRLGGINWSALSVETLDAIVALLPAQKETP